MIWIKSAHDILSIMIWRTVNKAWFSNRKIKNLFVIPKIPHLKKCGNKNKKRTEIDCKFGCKVTWKICTYVNVIFSFFWRHSSWNIFFLWDFLQWNATDKTKENWKHFIFQLSKDRTIIPMYFPFNILSSEPAACSWMSKANQYTVHPAPHQLLFVSICAFMSRSRPLWVYVYNHLLLCKTYQSHSGVR